MTIIDLPYDLEKEMHPRSDRMVAVRILEYLSSAKMACLKDVAREARCTYPTARKHLARMVNAGIVEEEQVGRLRIFVRGQNEMRRI